jgi:hypothetical protein
MKLTSITEATYARQSKSLYCLVEQTDDGQFVYGPFNSSTDARDYIDRIIQDYFNPEWAEIEVQVLEQPRW